MTVPHAPQWGGRRTVLVGIGLAGLAAAIGLGLDPRELLPSGSGWEVAGRFFRGALSPALTSEAEFIPAGAQPLLIQAALAAVRTVVFALAAVSLALLFGFVLALLGTTAWWDDDLASPTRKRVGTTLYLAVRALIAGLRSIHELIWAVLFLSALGLTHVTAAIAIAIPYAGTFAKVFSEIIDEAPAGPARALRATGASPLRVLIFGLLPQALPDLFSYFVYRLECGLRASAVLGFFGIPTLGLAIKLSFENTYYNEVWTYLYTLFALIVIFEWWSGAIRRKVVS